MIDSHVHFKGAGARLLCLFLLGAFVLGPSLGHAALDHATLKEILIREHSRNVEDGYLAERTTDSDAAVRARAYKALGRIQNEATLDLLAHGLQDSEVKVRREAVFALSQLEIPEAVPHLRGLVNDPDESIRTMAIEGLGKAYDESVYPDLSTLLNSDDPVQVAAAATAIGFAAVRGLKATREALPGLRRAIIHSDDEVLWRACFAVQRGRHDHVIQQPLVLLKHPNPLVRIYGLKAMAAASPIGHSDKILPLMKDPDWRVRVEAVRALARTKEKTLVPRMSLLLDDPNQNVMFATAQALVDLGFHEGLARFDDWQHSGDWKIRGAYLRHKAAVSGAGALPLLYTAAKDPNWHLRVVAADGLGIINTTQSLVALEPMVQDEHPSVQAAAINALVPYGEEAATVAIRPAFKSTDVTVLVSAANAAEQRLDRGALPLMLNAYSMLQSPYDSESMVAILQAIGTVLVAKDEDGAVGTISPEDEALALEVLEEAYQDADFAVAARAAESLAQVRGETPLKVVRPPKLPEGFDADLVAQLELSTTPVTATIKTWRGSITLELHPQVAPATVANFVSLARNGFYDGLTFHRVVPDFVIQGGDPRGDGWGGPGYSIRCEYGSVPFETGTVGMAHSGKDTAGSQFFINHAPMPHLNGRYTAFGKVLSGQDVVDKIQVSDVIESITIEGL